MGLQWIKESNPVWDEGKQRIVGKTPAGIFDRRYAELESDQLVPGEWWRAEEEGRVVGYGWLDVVWGDAEILLAIVTSWLEKRGFKASEDGSLLRVVVPNARSADE